MAPPAAPAAAAALAQAFAAGVRLGHAAQLVLPQMHIDQQVMCLCMAWHGLVRALWLACRRLAAAQACAVGAWGWARRVDVHQLHCAAALLGVQSAYDSHHAQLMTKVDTLRVEVMVVVADVTHAPCSAQLQQQVVQRYLAGSQKHYALQGPRHLARAHPCAYLCQVHGLCNCCSFHCPSAPCHPAPAAEPVPAAAGATCPDPAAVAAAGESVRKDFVAAGQQRLVLLHVLKAAHSVPCTMQACVCRSHSMLSR